MVTVYTLSLFVQHAIKHAYKLRYDVLLMTYKHRKLKLKWQPLTRKDDKGSESLF